ncbi:hypothetical protein SLA2020_046280 [Shorea laevis]
MKGGAIRDAGKWMEKLNEMFSSGRNVAISGSPRLSVCMIRTLGGGNQGRLSWFTLKPVKQHQWRSVEMSKEALGLVWL